MLQGRTCPCSPRSQTDSPDGSRIRKGLQKHGALDKKLLTDDRGICRNHVGLSWVSSTLHHSFRNEIAPNVAESGRTFLKLGVPITRPAFDQLGVDFDHICGGFHQAWPDCDQTAIKRGAISTDVAPHAVF